MFIKKLPSFFCYRYMRIVHLPGQKQPPLVNQLKVTTPVKSVELCSQATMNW